MYMYDIIEIKIIEYMYFNFMRFRNEVKFFYKICNFICFLIDGLIRLYCCGEIMKVGK